MINKLLKKILPNVLIRKMISFKNDYLDDHCQKTYSQEGEDKILERIFSDVHEGFYVDVGAHHPRRFSNTYLFYRKGWRGINIDAKPGSMTAFKHLRPRDINLEQPIADCEKKMVYYSFKEPALNGFDEIISNKRVYDDGCELIEKIPLRTKPLSSVLSEFLPLGQHVDFLSIDVEGLDFEVLRSNDWDHCSPSIVLFEALSSTLDGILKSEEHDYLVSKGYQFYAKCMNTVIYRYEA